MMINFSVCTSVYKNDNSNYVRIALNSITTEQTCQPSEVVLVVDGPVPGALSNVIKSYESSGGFHVIWLPENRGLGNALKLGVENAKYPIIARMDSDDISAPDRFEKQLNYLEEHPDCDIVGGQMTEFIDHPDNIVGRRGVPLTNEDIYKYMKSRCGLNHVTVMFRKDAVLKAGNYQDWFWNEDYYLWLRMMIAGCKFANLPDTLVNVRVGKDMYARRGGLKYFKSEASLQKYMWNNGIIPFPQYVFNILVRLCVQILMPNWLRGFVFQKLFRK